MIELAEIEAARSGSRARPARGAARVIAGGAGALALAIALAGRAGTGKVVCVVSGGNINLSKLAGILNGATG